MNNFQFYSPTKVIFGKDTTALVGESIKEFGGSKVLVHYGSNRVIENGLMEQVKKSLDSAGLEYVLLGGVVPNPRVSLVREGAELVKKEKIDFILSLGGGSIIDSAKGIAMAAVNDFDIWDIYTGKKQPACALPIGCILTLAAAGSETSASSVLTNEDGWIKIGYSNNKLRPTFAIMNPEFLFSLPAYQTSAGITDIMMHTLDRYFSQGGRNELTDCIAEEVLKVAIKYGKKCLLDPTDYEARSEMMWAGSLSHNDLTGLGRPGDFAPHMLEHELSGKYDVTHGAGLAAMWPTWARFVYKEDPMRFARYGVKVWGLAMDFMSPETTALEAIKATEDYFVSINMPVTIPQLVGKIISASDIVDMADKCTRANTHTIGSFMPLDQDKVAQIYTLANI